MSVIIPVMLRKSRNRYSLRVNNQIIYTETLTDAYMLSDSFQSFYIFDELEQQRLDEYI